MFETMPIPDLTQPTLFDFFVNLVVALLCGLVIAGIFRLTARGPAYSSGLAQSLVMLSLITAVVILVIGNNLARAFGLVGAMSIIRFRTAVRQVQDIVFIFFSLAAGMAAGVGLRVVALGGTAFIAAIFLLLDLVHFGRQAARQHLLQVRWQPEGLELAAVEKLLRTHARKLELLNLRSDPADGQLQGTWMVRFRKMADASALVTALRQTEGIAEVTLLQDHHEDAHF